MKKNAAFVNIYFMRNKLTDVEYGDLVYDPYDRTTPLGVVINTDNDTDRFRIHIMWRYPHKWEYVYYRVRHDDDLLTEFIFYKNTK